MASTTVSAVTKRIAPPLHPTSFASSRESANRPAASANVAVVFRYGPRLFAFAGLILLVHLAVILLSGWLLRLDLAEIVIASNANMGGPTTAAAMAAARRWEALVLPAVLCGTLGYAAATFLGVALGFALR